MIELIDFIPPAGLAIRVDSQCSSFLSKSIALRLPSRVFSLGFAHQSPVLKSNSLFGPYFMFGRVSVDEGGTMEAYYCQKISQRGLFTLSSLMSSMSANGRSHFQWNFTKTTLASSYCTHGRILGLQYLTHVSPQLSLGGEVYYTAQENSGGVSGGLRLDLGEGSVITVTGNPLMGHYRSTLASPLGNGFRASCRYDININSFESDLAAAVGYEDEQNGQGIRAAYGLKSGLTFALHTRLSDALKLRFGLRAGQVASYGLDLVFIQ